MGSDSIFFPYDVSPLAEARSLQKIESDPIYVLYVCFFSAS